MPELPKAPPFQWKQHGQAPYGHGQYWRGDFFVIWSPGFVGNAIRVLTRSRVNHAGIITTTAGTTVEAEAAGAVAKAVRPGMIFSNDMPISTRQADVISATALSLLGTPYDFADIAALAFKQFGISNRWIDKRIAAQGRMICSQLVDFCYLHAGIHLFDDGREPMDVTPGDLAELLLERPWEGNPSWGKR